MQLLQFKIKTMTLVKVFFISLIYQTVKEGDSIGPFRHSHSTRIVQSTSLCRLVVPRERQGASPADTSDSRVT